MKRISIPAALIFLALSLKAQDSPQAFVQNFYNWYTPIALKSQKGPGSDIALRSKALLFSRELAKALREDSQAQAKAQGEIVGIDWDPFLNSQDPEDQYEAAKVTQIGDRYFVDVYGLNSGKRHEKPEVVVELRQDAGKWVFVNFHSVDGHNLLASLKSLSESRHKPSK